MIADPHHQAQRYSLPYHHLASWDAGCEMDYLASIQRVADMAASLASGRLIIDAGCGDGRLCRELDARGARWAGFDADSRAVAWGQLVMGDVGTALLHANLAAMPFNDGVAAVIVLHDVWEHLEPSARPAARAELARVLADGGRVIVTVPTPSTPTSKDHYEHFTVESLAASLAPEFAPTSAHGQFRVGWRWTVTAGLMLASGMLAPAAGRMPGAMRSLVAVTRRWIAGQMDVAPDHARRLCVVARMARESR